MNAGFSDDATAVINLGAKSITIPQSPSTRFYRLRSTVATQILNIQIVDTNVVMTYQ